MINLIYLNRVNNKRRFSLVSYINGKDILPAELLSELQKYVQGEIIYIPREEKTRAGWGEMNGTRAAIKERNEEIYNYYSGGMSVYELMDKYHLSEDSIRKIVVKEGSLRRKAV